MSESYSLHFVVCHLTVHRNISFFTGNNSIFQNVKSTNMEPLVSMIVGIVLISKTAKKYRESAKRVVIPAGMDRTAIIVSIPKKKKFE